MYSVDEVLNRKDKDIAQVRHFFFLFFSFFIFHWAAGIKN
jgi:hypothetical protein